MTDRRLVIFMLMMITADNLAELAADLLADWREHQRREAHLRQLAEIRAKLGEGRP